MITPLTNLRMEMVTLPGNLACIWMSECHIVWVAVSKELPCQREWANSEASFTVMAMTGKLILGCEKISTVLLNVCKTKWVNFLLSYWIHSSTTMCLPPSTTCQQEIYGGRNFHEKTFLWAGVGLRETQKFLPCKHFLLYSMYCLLTGCKYN